MRGRIWLLGIMGSALLLWGPGTALADELTGLEIVRGKDSRAATVQLGDRVFAVTDDTVIHDAGGARIELADLAVPDFGRGESDPMLGALLAEYTAIQAGDDLVLRSLDVKSLND
ncbi:MAG: hypothetical protein ACE5FA_11355 [Dehalococcoidia bacterium]